MPSKETVQEQAEAFGKEWNGKFSIWGFVVSASPSQYDEYGKLPRGGPKDFGFHVYTSDENDIDKIPNMWNGIIPVMVFVDIKSNNDE